MPPAGNYCATLLVLLGFLLSATPSPRSFGNPLSKVCAFPHPNTSAARGRHFCTPAAHPNGFGSAVGFHNKEVLTFPPRRLLPGRSSGSASSILNSTAH